MDVLKNLYEYDNTNFIIDLQSRGFIVPSNNHSNYHKTFLSIPSTLNMDYIQNITPGLEEIYFWWLMSPLIEHSQTHIMLEEIGYTSVFISTDWTITNNKTSDIYYQPSSFQTSEFETFFLHNSFLKILIPTLDKFVYMPMTQDGHREMVLYNFETISEPRELLEPYFMFAHIVSPHPPFVFDKDGTPINPNPFFSFNDGNHFFVQSDSLYIQEKRDKAYREGYVQQVQFVNEQLINTIDSIFEHSENPPIIIIMADHGSGFATDFRSSENTCLFERFSPFAAYYLPGIDEKKIPDDISSINLFRVVFNEYFQTEFPLLENHYYFSKNEHLAYWLEEISLEQINAPCQIQP